MDPLRVVHGTRSTAARLAVAWARSLQSLGACDHVRVAIDTSGRWWRGSSASDIVEYLGAYTADGYPVTQFVLARCSECGGDVFSLRVDAGEGCAERTCVWCGRSALMLDSAETLEGAHLARLRCGPGHTGFNVGVGFAYRDDGEVRWVYIGTRCVADGILGAAAEWKIDYSPSKPLESAVQDSRRTSDSAAPTARSSCLGRAVWDGPTG